MDILEGLWRNFQDPAFMRDEWLALAQAFGFTWGEFVLVFLLATIAIVCVVCVIWGARRGPIVKGTAAILFVMAIFMLSLVVNGIQAQWVCVITLIAALLLLF